MKQQQQQRKNGVYRILFVCHCYFKKLLLDRCSKLMDAAPLRSLYSQRKQKKNDDDDEVHRFAFVSIWGIVLFNILIWMLRFVGKTKNSGKFKWFSNESTNHHEHKLIECKTLSFNFGNVLKKLHTYLIPHRLLNKVVTWNLNPLFPFFHSIFLIMHQNGMQNKRYWRWTLDKETKRN